MEIEQSMILKGSTSISDKILNFINTLVIKNNQEGDLNETNETFEHYEKLRKCGLKLTTFSDHLEYFGELPPELQNKSIEALNNELADGSIIAQETITMFRDKFTETYIDKNPYFAILSGNPVDSSQEILIIDRDNTDLKFFDVTDKLIEYDDYNLSDGNLTLFDVKKATFPNFYSYLYDQPNPDGRLNIEKDYNVYSKIPLHKINYRKSPNTYTAVYVDGIIDKIRNNSATDYEYLKYITLNLDIHAVRDANHFDILWYDPFMLDDNEIDNFFNAYNSVKEYVLSNKYMKGLEELYTHYSNFELIVILFGTFQKICVSYIDTYNVRHYSDKEIYDILDSHNLSSLRAVDISILRKVVDNLDILLSYRGTEEVLQKIMEIASLDNALSIKKYDLVKSFKTDDLGLVGLKKERGMYDKNVDLAFVDRTIASSSGSSTISPDNQVIDYEDFVIRDPYWANSGVYETEDGKLNAIRKVKKEILNIEFNRMSTKYIGAISIINMYDKYQYMVHKIGLLIQFYSNFKQLNDIIYPYNNLSLTPFQLFSLASCANKHVISIDNSSVIYDDTITPECYSYEKMMKLNTLSKLNTLEILSNLPIVNSNSPNNIASKTVGDILSQKEISENIIFFDTSHFSFKDIIHQYDDNYAKLNKLIAKSMDSIELNESMAWNAIVDYFLITVDTSLDYILPTTFTDLFNEMGGDAYLLYETYILNGTETELKTFARTISTAFQNSISNEIDEAEILSNTSNEDKVGLDLSLLIKAFVSVYVELRDVTINLNMSDYPYNKYQLTDYSYITDYKNHQDIFAMTDKYSIFEYSTSKEEYKLTEVKMYQERL